MISQSNGANFSMSFDESRYYGLSKDGVFRGNIRKSRRKQSGDNELITFNPDLTDATDLNARMSSNYGS